MSSLVRRERQPEKRPGDRYTRRERWVLVDAQCFLVAGDRHDAVRCSREHRALGTQVVEVRVRVGNQGLVGEDNRPSRNRSLKASWSSPRSRMPRHTSNSTGSDVGERNTCPRMCGSSPSGSIRRLGSRSSSRLMRRAHLEPRQVHAETDVHAVAPAEIAPWACGRCRTRRGRASDPPADWPSPSIGMHRTPRGDLHARRVRCRRSRRG